MDFKSPLFKDIYNRLDVLEDITTLISESIMDDPPINIKEGGIIRTGYNEEIDRLRNAKTEGKTWLAEMEASEKESTGIKNLKIKYNKVFGYYIEVSNSFKDQVPDYYVRKQTLTNAERYTTDKLKELEDVIMRWAPPCENNTEVYIATVEKRSGISRHTILNRNNREQLIAVVAAMSYVENGVPANMDEVRKGWELI